MPVVLAKAEAEKAGHREGSDPLHTYRPTLVAVLRLPAWHHGCYQQRTALHRLLARHQAADIRVRQQLPSTPTTTLIVFPLPDDYSFGILQSGVHWGWFTARCSTLKGDFRYTSDTVFDTFPWPQAPTPAHARAVADAAVSLRALRRQVMAKTTWSLRDLYRTLDLPGKNPLRDAQDALDAAVRAAYGMKPKDDPLAFLLALNQAVAAREAAGEPVVAPGLPPCVTEAAAFITEDCVRAPAAE